MERLGVEPLAIVNCGHKTKPATETVALDPVGVVRRAVPRQTFELCMQELLK